MRDAIWFWLSLVALATAPAWLQGYGRPVVSQSTLAEHRIFAYRDWQNTGVRVTAGDRVRVRAQGEWLYTPDEYHGPAGHPRYPAPTFYPVPYGPGGALIGRIGEAEAPPFPVGEGRVWIAERTGLLHLRINDDRLGDNRGWVEVTVTVTPGRE